MGPYNDQLLIMSLIIVMSYRMCAREWQCVCVCVINCMMCTLRVTIRPSKKITERVETSFCRPFLGAPLLSKTNVTQGPNYNTKFEIRRV